MLKNILISKLFEIELLDVALGNYTLNQIQKIQLDSKLKQLESGVPLDYIIGKVKLLGLQLIVNEDTLIPREETEFWLQKYKIECTQFSPCLIDLGTGTGIIGLYLSNIYKKVYLLDIDQKTLEVTKQNIELNQKTNCQTLLIDGLENIEKFTMDSEKWDLIANLPYLPSEDINKAREYKVEHEPAIALYSGKDGLQLFNKVLEQIEKIEKKPQNVVFELDPRNIRQAQLNIDKLNYKTKIWLDQNGLKRVLVGVLNNS